MYTEKMNPHPTAVVSYPLPSMATLASANTYKLCCIEGNNAQFVESALLLRRPWWTVCNSEQIPHR